MAEAKLFVLRLCTLAGAMGGVACGVIGYLVQQGSLGGGALVAASAGALVGAFGGAIGTALAFQVSTDQSFNRNTK